MRAILASGVEHVTLWTLYSGIQINLLDFHNIYIYIQIE
jgi:hypothetical protein